MAKVKVTRQDLKRDELKDFGLDLADYLHKHRFTIGIVLGIIIVLWLGSKLYGMHKEGRLEEANRQLQTAISYYQAGIYSEDPAARAEALTRSNEVCESLRSRYAGLEAARQALLIMAAAKYYQGSPDSAVADLTQYRETASEPDDKALACIQTGYCYENQYFNSGMKQTQLGEQAVGEYQKAEKLAVSQGMRNHALLGQARMYEVIADVNRAVALYEKIIADSKNLKEELGAKFKPADEGAKKVDTLQIPSVAELFDATHVAQVQLDRLKSLIESGDAEAAKTRAVPEDAPATATLEAAGAVSASAPVVRSGNVVYEPFDEPQLEPSSRAAGGKAVNTGTPKAPAPAR